MSWQRYRYYDFFPRSTPKKAKGGIKAVQARHVRSELVGEALDRGTGGLSHRRAWVDENRMVLVFLRKHRGRELVKLRTFMAEAREVTANALQTAPE